MALRIIILVAVALLVISPAIFGDRLKVREITGEEIKKLRIEQNRRSYSRWKGPKTDERINSMLAETIVLMKELGVPISESICPEVKLTGSHSYFGRCCPKGSLKRYTVEYDYYIELSGHTLHNSEKSLRNTLIHELIHTVPGGQCHTGNWRKWAKHVSEKTDYHISYCGVEDETEQDLKNLRNYN